MTKNKKLFYLGLVIVLLGIWLTIFTVSASSDFPIVIGLASVYGTPIGFILMLVGIFKKEN